MAAAEKDLNAKKEQDKNTFLSEYTSLFGKVTPPEYIEYSDDIKKTAEKLSPDQLFERTDKAVRSYAGSYYIKKSDLIPFKQYCKEIFQKIMLNEMTGNKGGFQVQLRTTSKELKRKSLETAAKMRLVDLKEEVHISPLAKTKIEKHSWLAYGGEIKPASMNELTSLYYIAIGFASRGGEKFYGVDGKTIRDFGGYFAHLPARTVFHERFEVEDVNLLSKIAMANFVMLFAYLEDLDIIVPVLVALRDIEPGEVLGWDYNEDVYFGECLKTAPRLLFKDGALVPQDKYRSKNLYFRVKLPDGGTLDLPKMPWESMKSSCERPYIILNCDRFAVFLAEAGKKELLSLYGQRFVTMAPDGLIDKTVLKKISEKIVEVLGQQMKQFLDSTEAPWEFTLDKIAMTLKPKLTEKNYQFCLNKFKEAGIDQYILFNKINTNKGERYTLSIKLEHCCNLARRYNLLDLELVAKIKQDLKSTSTKAEIKIKKDEPQMDQSREKQTVDAQPVNGGVDAVPPLLLSQREASEGSDSDTVIVITDLKTTPSKVSDQVSNPGSRKL